MKEEDEILFDQEAVGGEELQKENLALKEEEEYFSTRKQLGEKSQERRTWH